MENTPQQLLDMVQSHLAPLMEHFDGVQILASISTDNGTQRVFLGRGNWYARQGMAHEFINMDIAQGNAAELAQRIQPPDNDGETWKS